MVKSLLSHNVILAQIVVVMLSVVSSCSDEMSGDVSIPDQDLKEWHTATLYYTPVFPEADTRAFDGVKYVPEMNDIMIIKFMTSDESSVHGYAKYDAERDEWTLTYSGNLSDCNNQKCEIIYIGKPKLLPEIDNVIYINIDSPVFNCNEGRYEFSEQNVVDLSGRLTPSTSRVRFKGDGFSSFKVKGFGTYRSYFLDDFSLNEGWCLNLSEVELSNTPDGSLSHYCYVFSQDEGSSSGYWNYVRCDCLWIKAGENVYLWKKKTSDYLKKGSSGIINLPSVDPDGWYSDVSKTKNIPDFKVNFNSEGEWTQTQEQTRFYSDVGIFVRFDFYITGEAINRPTDYPFRVLISAYDVSGNLIDSREDRVHKDRLYNRGVNYYTTYFVQGASYYQIQIYEFGLKADVRNCQISNFDW